MHAAPHTDFAHATAALLAIAALLSGLAPLAAKQVHEQVRVYAVQSVFAAGYTLLVGIDRADAALIVLAAWTVSIGGAAAVGHVSRLGWLIEPGYPKFASISPTVLAITLAGFAFGAACLRYLFSMRRSRKAPVWASGVAVSGRRAQYTPIGYVNMVRVIFNVVYRVKTQLRSVGDQRFPERLSMMRAEPRVFDPQWLYRPVTGAFLRVAAVMRNIQAGPLGLYLLYVLLAFIAPLLIALRLM